MEKRSFLQEQLPFALVQGEPLLEAPTDLYIPPDALEVFLEAFEGPLDLLLYLIRKQNLDILDIPIADITSQYIDYIAMMKDLRLELAAEYLVMAAMLAEIKSRMLLPRPPRQDEEEGDPRAELVRRLQEYERFKKAAEEIDMLPRLQRDLFPVDAAVPDKHIDHPLPDVDLQELLFAFHEVMRRADLYSSHQVEREALSVRERMSNVLARVQHAGFVPFTDLFAFKEGRMGVVVTFMAILELIKERLLELVQVDAFGVIHVKAGGCSSHVE